MLGVADVSRLCQKAAFPSRSSPVSETRDTVLLGSRTALDAAT